MANVSVFLLGFETALMIVLAILIPALVINRKKRLRQMEYRRKELYEENGRRSRLSFEIERLRMEAQYGKDLAEALRFKARGWPANIDIIIPQKPEQPKEPVHDSYSNCSTYGVECHRRNGDYTCDYCPGGELIEDSHVEWDDYRVRLAQWEKDYMELERAQYLKKLIESQLIS